MTCRSDDQDSARVDVDVQDAKTRRRYQECEYEATYRPHSLSPYRLEYGIVGKPSTIETEIQQYTYHCNGVALLNGIPGNDDVVCYIGEHEADCHRWYSSVDRSWEIADGITHFGRD